MATLQYDFRVIGINSVMAAFSSLERRALTHNARVNQMFSSGRAGGGGVRTGAMRGGVAGLRAGPQQDSHVREFNRMRAVRLRNDAAVLREESTRHKNWTNLKNQLNNDRLRVEDRHARQANAAARSRSTRQRGVGRGALTGLGSMASGALALGGAALLYGSARVLSNGIRGELQVGKSAALLAGLSRQAGGKGDLKTIQNSISSRALSVSTQTGMDREDVIGGMSSFFGVSGNLDAAKSLSPLFADMAQFSGASMQDIGKMAGMAYMQAMASQMTHKQAEEATEGILRAFAGQAAAGSINMEDYARSAPSILTTAGRFGGNYGNVAATVSAIGQASPLGGANKAAEAATALARFSDTLVEQGGKDGTFAKAGIEVFEKGANGTVTMRDPMQLIREILLQTKMGDDRELAKFGFNIRGKKAVTGFNRIYRQAEAEQKGSGIAAVDAHFNRFARANVDPKMQKEILANYRDTPAMKFEMAFNDFKNVIGQQFLPALTKLAPQMGKLVTAMEPVIAALARFTESLVDNPWGTIIKAIEVAIVASIIKSAIGGTIQTAILALLTKGGVPLVGPSVAPVVPPVATVGSGLMNILGKAYMFLNLIQMEGDAASKTSAEEEDSQQIATKKAYEQLKRTGTMDVETSRSVGPFDVIRKRYTAEGVGPNQLAQIPLTDFINQFGRKGAIELGLMDEQGNALPAKQAGQKMQESEKQKSAEMLQAAAKALTEAAASMKQGSFGDGLLSLLTGGGNVNRSDSPGVPAATAGGRGK